MLFNRREFLLGLGGSVAAPVWSAPDLSPDWPDAKIEEFLTNGKVVKAKTLGTGITNSLRLTLDWNGEVRDAHFQSINEAKSQYQTVSGTELNFRDSWKYNIAGYKLDRLLGLRMTPPSIERSHGGKGGAFTWWIKDAMMESERVKKKIQPPQPDAWNNQMYIVRVFDQLIFNTDRNLQNLMITKDWQIWMIDHTRAFRWHKDIKEPKNLVKCERRLFARLKSLTEDEVVDATKPYLTELEVTGLMGRRDKIVALYEKKIASSSEGAVLYDYTRA